MKKNPKWSVYVFSNKLGLGDEWAFVRFSHALRFAKKKLKQGFGVTIDKYNGKTLVHKGDYK